MPKIDYMWLIIGLVVGALFLPRVLSMVKGAQ